MRKLTLLALAALVSGAAFAQDAPAVKRTFRAYMDVISGNMIASEGKDSTNGGIVTSKAAGKVWSGNEYEIGIGYAQNWAKVPWLTTSFVVKFGINPTWMNNADGTAIARAENQGIYQGTGKGLWIRGQFGLDFSKYFSFYMDSRLLTGLTLQYVWNKGAHGIMLQTGIEFFAGNYSLSGAKFKNMRQAGFEGAIAREGATGPMIDAFWIDFVWNASLPKGFANSLLIRPVGFTGDNPSEIAEGYYIRLQETLSWSNAGFSVYARIRYNIKGIASPTYTIAGTSNKYKYGVVHDLSLRAGIAYAYDLSKL